MRPIIQTQFYDPTAPVDQQRGNCLQAALASLLELPMEDVPHFVQDHVDHDGDNVTEWNWWLRLWQWLQDRGLSMITASDGVCDPEPGEYVLAMGPSPRGNGIHHVVINRDGQLAHDPHPDATGLDSIQDVYMVRPHPRGD